MSDSDLLVPNPYNLFSNSLSMNALSSNPGYIGASGATGYSLDTLWSNNHFNPPHLYWGNVDLEGSLIPGPTGPVAADNANTFTTPFLTTYSSPTVITTHTTPLMNWFAKTSQYNNKTLYMVAGRVQISVPTNIGSLPSSEQLSVTVNLNNIVNGFSIGSGFNYTLLYSDGQIGGSTLSSPGGTGAAINLIADGIMQSDGSDIVFTFYGSGELWATSQFPLELLFVFNRNSDGVFPVKSMVNISHTDTIPYNFVITQSAGAPDFSEVVNVTLDIYGIADLVVTPTTISFTAPSTIPGTYLIYGIYLHSVNDTYIENIGFFVYPTD